MKKNHRFRYFMNDEYDTPFVEKIKTKPNRSDAEKNSHATLSRRQIRKDQDFRCANCNRFVSTKRESCGVNHRNHCPYCLWSRHLDDVPGDRKAGCHCRMNPLGLTLKRTNKKYGCIHRGEIMLIHECTGCNKISINRIAGDDDPLAIQKLFLESQSMPAEMVARLFMADILPLKSGDFTAVFTQLFGWQPVVESMQQHAPVSEVVEVK
jgi:hypothetical protein